MKNTLLLALISLFIIISCKTPEEKMSSNILNSINKYHESAGDKAGLEIKNCVIKKIDTLNTALETLIVSNYLKNKIIFHFDEKQIIAEELEEADISLRSAQEINRISNFQSVVDGKEYERTILKKRLEECESKLNEYDRLNNLIISQALKNMDGNDNFFGYYVDVSYDVKLPDTSMKHVDNVFILNRDYEVQDQDSYVESIKAKYLPKE